MLAQDDRGNLVEASGVTGDSSERQEAPVEMLVPAVPPVGVGAQRDALGLAQLGAQGTLGPLQSRGVDVKPRLRRIGGDACTVVKGERETRVEQDRAGSRFEEGGGFLV